MTYFDYAQHGNGKSSASVNNIHNSLLHYIYILGAFTEKSYSKPMERNVVYIPITTSSHETSKYTTVLYNLLDDGDS